jgi:light-regulated signal transduction histidine kinase (bacteriophytochrome)
VAEAVRVLEPSIQEAGASVTWDDSLPAVLGDRAQLVQLVQNLVGNAVKYHGPRSPVVHVSASRNGDDWAFAVEDNGIGIDARQHEKIFEVFRRLHDQQEYPGTGVGLAVCRRVVLRHGGRIWVDSTPGEGSVFRFTIPARGA